MVETKELVSFLRMGKRSEADIRLRFGSCPRKLLKELVAIELIYKTTNPIRYYATPIEKKIKAKLVLNKEDLEKLPVSVRVNDKEAKIVFAERGIISNPADAIIHGGTTIPLGKKLKKSEFPIESNIINVEAWNDKEVAKIAEHLWDNPKPKKDGWFKRLLKRNAKH